MTKPTEAAERVPLSADRIEEAALAAIERVGLAAFSLRKLADDLGCTAMSLYHYYPSKEHLMDALIDRVVGTLPPMPPVEVPWRERLRRVALNWRAMALAHPALFPFIATHRMNTPRCLAWLDSVVALVRHGIANDEDAARLFRAVGYYLAGSGLEETAGYGAGPSTVSPVPDALMAKRFPHVVAVAPWFAPAEREATFLRGLDALIDGWTGTAPREAASPRLGQESGSRSR
ncbi:MAG: TetR/AcrR family transcriptional regulator [Amaricoccus sp.]